MILRAVALLLVAGCTTAPPISAPPLCEPHFNVRPDAPRAWPASSAQLLDREEVAGLNRRNRSKEFGFQDMLRPEVVDLKRVREELGERFVWLRERLADGRFVEGQAPDYQTAEALARDAAAADEVRVVHTEAALWCMPMTTGLYTLPIDRNFDRNRCSGLHPGELVRVMRVGAGDWLYVNTGHAVGWMSRTAATPPIEMAEAVRFRDQMPRAVVIKDGVRVEGGPVLRLGVSFPKLGDEMLLLPTPDGLRPLRAPDGWVTGYLPFTRKKLFDLVLSQRGAPYGWGGNRGNRDCSRLLMDAFATFDIRLSRHSSYQSKSGMETVDLEGKTDAQKRAAIRAAAVRGSVFLYMPGHIMLYLGEAGGKPYAISSLGEYLRPCASKEQLMRVDRVVVHDLELGRGTSKTAFVSRLTRLAVFGR